MKKFILLLIPIAIFISSISIAGVRETKHNFSSQTYSPNAFFYGTAQVCVFCHTAHHSDVTDPAPLWNHENSAETYDMYGSNTMDMSRTPQPNNGSLVCLSCHDGTIAINSLNNVPGSQGAGTFGTPGGSSLDGAGKLTTSSHAFIGTNLQDDHPVGIIYDQSQDLDFEPKTGNPDLYPDKLLDDGIYVECNSCHDPHDNTYTNFLVESNANSQLCTRCHQK
jgi:predicted CXXCH cytochrome family protein